MKEHNKRKRRKRSTRRGRRREKEATGREGSVEGEESTRPF
jgi:hypothetical protein